jgi:hypothetical protein
VGLALVLAAGRAVAAPPAAPPGLDEARARAELARILDGQEFRTAGHGAGSGAALAVAWGRLAAWAARQPPGRTGAIIGACLLVLALVGLHVTLSVRAVLRGDRGGRVRPAEAPPRRSAGELRAVAEAASAAGDHAAAVRLFYLATLAALEEGGLCELRAGLADSAVLARCGGRAAALEAAVRLFQESRYGGRAVGPAAVARCRACLDAITPVPQVGGGRAPSATEAA